MTPSSLRRRQPRKIVRLSPSCSGCSKRCRSICGLAWSLRYMHEETVESVAELCGCSLATAKRRISAAQGRINEELSDG